MEPLSQEYVEQTADFFFHLSKGQLEERIAEYKRKQMYLHQLVRIYPNTVSDANYMDIKWRFSLLVHHCFESYINPFPVVTKQNIDRTIARIERKRNEHSKEKSDIRFVELIITETDQIELYNFIDAKICSLEEEGRILDFVEGSKYLTFLITMGLILKDELMSKIK